MASPSPNFTYNNFSTQSNFAFIVIKPKANYYSLAKQNTTLAVLGIAVSALINVLQIKYQPEANSPFETHPKTMAIAIASLLIYCFGCDAEQYVSYICSSTWAILVHNVTTLFCFISLASFASIIYSSSSISSVSIYLFFALLFSVRLILQWIRNRTTVENREGYNYNNVGRRNNVQFLDAFFDEIDTLPLYRITHANHLHSNSNVEND